MIARPKPHSSINMGHKRFQDNPTFTPNATNQSIVNHSYSRPGIKNGPAHQSYMTPRSRPIIQNNNFITLNNNQTIIANFNNILSNKKPSPRSSNNSVHNRRTNSVVSVHDGNTSFISRDYSQHSAYANTSSKVYMPNPGSRLSNRSNLSQKSGDGQRLNFRYDRSLSQRGSPRQMIPRNRTQTSASRGRSTPGELNTSNLEYSIVKGNRQFIQSKKREFSKNKGQRAKSPGVKFTDWSMESNINKEMNFDYSKPYKSPDKISNRSASRKNSERYDPLQIKAQQFKLGPAQPQKLEVRGSNQVISLANSKHFESKKSESLLNKLKENQVQNIDFNNLDLGKKKYEMHSSKLKQSGSFVDRKKKYLDGRESRVPVTKRLARRGLSEPARVQSEPQAKGVIQ